jgi:Ca2+-binding RTX toxin-like protein
MTTFIAGGSHAFNSTFNLPNLFDRPPIFVSNYETIRTPERMFVMLSTFFPSFVNPGSSYAEVDVAGTSMALTGNAITSGMIQNVSQASSSSSRFTGSTAGSYTIVDINLSAASLNAAAASSPASAWALITEGNDTFVCGSAGDYLIGGSGANTILAAGGNDFIVAGSLNAATPTNASLWSYVDGGTGDDTIYAGYGANTNLLGGDGNDIIVDGLGTDFLNGGAGNDYLAAGSGVNVFDFNIDAIIGGQFDAVDYFTAATNYISLPTAYEGAFGFTQYGADTLISLSTYYIFVLNTPVATVLSHTFYD